MKDLHPQQRTATIVTPEAVDAALEDEETIDLAQYWRTIRRHKWGILSITLLALIVGLLYAISATPIYKAKTVLLADPIQPNVDSQNQYVNTALVYLFYETQYEIIKSRSVAEKAVDKLGLVEKQRRKQREQETAQPEAPRNFLEQIKAWKQAVADWRQWLPLDIAPEEETQEPTDQQLRRQLAARIQANLEVKGGKQSEIINVSYQSPDPREAADVANAIADAYMEFSLDARLKGAKKTATWLNEQLAELRRKLRESEAALEAYQKSHGLVDSSQQQQIASTRLSTLNAELIKAQTQRSEAEILYNQVKALKGKRGDYASLGPVLNSPSVRTLVQEESKLARRVKELSERYGEKHPKMIAARSDLNEARRALQREINKVVDNIAKKYRIALAQEQKIQRLIRQQQQEISELKGANFELARLEREVENNRRIYETFLARFQEADVSEKYDATNVRIIDPATVPETPYKPKKSLIIAVSVALGLFLGVLVAFLREALDNTFKTTDNIEEKLGIPTLGLVPLVKRRGRVNPESRFLADPRSQFSENINNIRTGILFSNVDHPPQVILITSASGSEGKSTLAANLAASLGQLDRTLLLEADLRKPSLANTLKLQRKPGLSDLVANRTDMAHFKVPMVGNDKGSFYAIPCGTLPPNPLELLSSEHFRALLKRLRGQFRYIVVDAPPVLAVSDAAVLGQEADSVILAVKAESTTVKAAREAISRLHKAHVRITGAVLTQAEPKRMAYYGGHYYHSSYYGYKAPKGEAA